MGLYFPSFELSQALHLKLRQDLRCRAYSLFNVVQNEALANLVCESHRAFSSCLVISTYVLQASVPE